MDERTPGTHQGPVNQLWAGYGKLLAVHAGGLFVFHEKEYLANWPRGGKGWSSMGSSCDPRLQTVLGSSCEGGLCHPTFDGAGDRLVLMSANHLPAVYVGI